VNSSKKTVLLTGSSGFLGHYIKHEFEKPDYNLITLGRKNCDIIMDLSKGVPNLPENIDFVIHAAGKAHMVPKSEAEVLSFFETNDKGTLNLLEAIKSSQANVKSIIFISSVAVYGMSQGVEISEDDQLLATDPYGKSKILAEIAIKKFCEEQDIQCCILRLPLIAGKNAPGNLGAMIKAITEGWYVSIGNANVKKSIVMAEDIAKLIPFLFDKSGTYNLTDGYHPTFRELEDSIAKALAKKSPVKIPQTIATVIAKAGDIIGKKFPINSLKLKKIQSELTFSDKKARKELGWKPSKVLDKIPYIV